MSSIPGKYKFIGGENVDQYLEKLGVGMVVRKVHSVTRPDLDITYDENKMLWSIIVESVFHKYQLDFKLDEIVECDETLDVRRCKTIVTRDQTQDTFLITQTPEEGEKVLTRIEKLPNGSIKFEMECGDNKAVQIYKAVVPSSGHADADLD